VVLHDFKSQGSKTRSVDSKFAAPYIGWWPFVISRLRNNQVAFGAKQISSGRQDWEAPSRLTQGRQQRRGLETHAEGPHSVRSSGKMPMPEDVLLKGGDACDGGTSWRVRRPGRC
jgi:hypothetical protein